MSHLVLLYGSVIGFALFLFMVFTRGDEARPTRLAKVRVWIDDQEHHRGEVAPDEESEQAVPGPWLFLLAAMVLLIVLLNAV